MEINVLDYLDDHEIKEIAQEEVRAQVRKHFSEESNAKRFLSNLSYQFVFDEVDRNIGDNSRRIIAEQTAKEIKDRKNFSYMVFRDKSYGSPASLAYTIMEQTVKENKELIKEKVVEGIVNKDYSDDIWGMIEEMSENFMSSVYGIVELAQKKNK